MQAEKPYEQECYCCIQDPVLKGFPAFYLVWGRLKAEFMGKLYIHNMIMCYIT